MNNNRNFGFSAWLQNSETGVDVEFIGSGDFELWRGKDTLKGQAVLAVLRRCREVGR